MQLNKIFLFCIIFLSFITASNTIFIKTIIYAWRLSLGLGFNDNNNNCNNEEIVE